MEKLGITWFLAVLPLAACHGAGYWREDADDEVYQILKEKRGELGIDEAFTIEPPQATLRESLLASETPELSLDLNRSLVVAAENSRDWQEQREALYRSALALTLERWNFSVQEQGTILAFIEGQGRNSQSGGFLSNLGFLKLFGTGLLMVGNVGIDFVRDVGQGDGFDAITHLSLNVTQPLLRGFGKDIVMEPLTQAERDVVYAARAYERFLHTFAVDVAERFFRVLEQRDRLANQEQNHANLIRLRARNEAFAEAGRVSDIDVDQARQDELRAQDSVIAARRDLANALDDFKFFLGLPIETDLTLDEGGQRSLEAWEALEIDLDEESVVTIALQRRLDYHTVVDRIADAERAAHVAADALRAGLDITSGVAANTLSATSDEGQPASFSSENFNWSVGLELDLPLDRLPERNVYRQTLIDWEARKRDEQETADRIRSDLRDFLRSLETARQSYTIQTGAVVLAARRVESTELNLEAGRASTRDVLEAQEALVGAQNDASAALTDYILAGLFLYRDMELLQVAEEGIQIDVDLLPAAEEEVRS